MIKKDFDHYKPLNEYRADSFQVRNDEFGSVFFERQLETIMQQAFEIAQAPMSSSILIPTNSVADIADKYFTYRRYRTTGKAKVFSDDMLAKDFPKVDVEGEEVVQSIKNIVSCYDMTEIEAYAASKASFNLELTRAKAAVESIMREINAISFVGDADFNLKGLFNLGITQTEVTRNGTGAGALQALWANKTPDQILEDLHAPVRTIFTSTNTVEKPNRIAMDPDSFMRIATTPRSTLSDISILDYFLQSQRTAGNNIQVVYANELTGAFTGGKNGFIVYDYSNDKIFREFTMEPRATAPQRSGTGLAYRVNFWARFGGLALPKPASITMRYGI